MTRPKIALKTFLLFALSGLLIGAVMPLVEFVALYALDLTGASALQYFFHGAALGDPWLSIVFVLVEMSILFFMARYNKTLACAALITTTIGTALVLNFIWHVWGMS